MVEYWRESTQLSVAGKRLLSNLERLILGVRCSSKLDDVVATTRLTSLVTCCGAQEDSDAAPCGALPLPEGVGEAPSAAYVHELSNSLFTGGCG